MFEDRGKPSSDPSVFDEPHMRGFARAADVSGEGSRCWKCGYNRAGLGSDRPGAWPCPECGAGEFDAGGEGIDAVDHSVFDDPTFSASLSGLERPGPGVYAETLRDRIGNTPRSTAWWMTLCLALAAGPWAIVGAFVGEIGSGQLSVFAVVLVAPVVEEVMKLAAATYAVERRPYWFKSDAQLMLCCAAGGVAFAAIENIVYLTIYYPRATHEMVVWRWTVCVALHAACSLIAGMGLLQVWRRTVTTLRRPELSSATAWLVVAMVVHGLYNAFAVLIESSGWAF